MESRTLTLRELNRTTLDRQLLLKRTSDSVPQTMERLVGLQAQALLAPFVGLWTRISKFSQNDLADLIQNRTILKATMMRGTLHLVTAADYQHFRTALQPMLELGATAILKGRGPAMDKSINPDDHFRDLVFRYLAAFGPASVTDIQT